MWYLFLVFACFGTLSSHAASRRPETNDAHIDIFVQRLQLENWMAEETPCLEKTLEIVENVKNFTLWATWVWTATAVPSGYLYGSWAQYGNFDQCMDPPWLNSHTQFRTQYCITDVKLTENSKETPDYDPYGSTQEYLDSPTKSGLPVNRLRWGVCLPASCHPSSIAKITKALYQSTNFGTISPNVTVVDCQVAGSKLQYSTGFYMFIGLIAVLSMTAAASTYYQSISREDHPSDSLETIISKSFCVVKNYQDLMKENKDEIKVMNGIRFITASMIVTLHETFYSMLSGISNSRDFENSIDGLPGFFLHVDVMVDTFLAMSGLLHIRGLLANADRQQNLFMVLWKRYIRLIGPFALTIFYLTSVSMYTGSGPIWHFANDLEVGTCSKTWGLSLLMLNTDPNYICHAVTWYLACDYQLAILGTVLFYFYQKNRRLGLAAFGTASVVSLIIPATLTYWYQLPAIHFLNTGKVLYGLRGYWELKLTYLSSYSRAGAYLVGIAMGYLMTVYKPAEYRRSISKTWSIIGTAVSLAVMGAMMSLGQFYIGREYYPLEYAVTVATNRVAWAIAVCCIIGLCEYGTVPVVSKALSFPLFTPLSRLSYGIYVIHPLLIQRIKFTLRSPFIYDIFTTVTNSMGVLTISVGLSFVMWMLVEAPLINLYNNLLCTKSKTKEQTKVTESEIQNGVEKRNGYTKIKAL